MLEKIKIQQKSSTYQNLWGRTDFPSMLYVVRCTRYSVRHFQLSTKRAPSVPRYTLYRVLFGTRNSVRAGDALEEKARSGWGANGGQRTSRAVRYSSHNTYWSFLLHASSHSANVTTCKKRNFHTKIIMHLLSWAIQNNLLG
jgi:hypothetical protein